MEYMGININKNEIKKHPNPCDESIFLETCSKFEKENVGSFTNKYSNHKLSRATVKKSINSNKDNQLGIEDGHSVPILLKNQKSIISRAKAVACSICRATFNNRMAFMAHNNVIHNTFNERSIMPCSPLGQCCTF